MPPTEGDAMSGAGTAEQVGWELRRSFETAGVRLAWDRWGPSEGTPLLLCHGFSGSAFDFALRVGDLAVDRPVFAVDHRGHGRSTKVGRVDAYSLDRLAADLAAFASEVIGGPFDLLGHSMGGVLAQKAVVDHSPDVRRLVLMNTSPTDFVPADPELAEALPVLLDAFDPADGLPGPNPGPETELIAAATPVAWQLRSAALGASFDPWAMKALGAELLGQRPMGLVDRLGQIGVPTLVLVGSNDHPLVDRSEILVDGIPDARRVVIDGAYHSPQLTHPAEWLDAVTDHLA